MNTAGRIFPHLIFFPNTMLIPIPKIRMEPIKDILVISLSLKNGSTSFEISFSVHP